MTAERRRPALLRLLAPPEVHTSTLVVALTSTLRSRGHRVGLATLRGGPPRAGATVLVTGSGARITLPAAPSSEVLRVRAAALDPALDLLLVTGDVDDPALPTIEVLAAGAAPTSRDGPLGAVAASQLERAGPTEDFGLAALIEAHLLAHPGAPGGLAEAAQAPIESRRRLLERSAPPPTPPRTTPSRWRRWLGL